MFFTKFLSDFYELNLNSLKTSIAKNKPQEINALTPVESKHRLHKL